MNAKPATIELTQKKALVKKQTYFSQLNDSEIETLATLMVEKTYTPGTNIVSQGDPVDSIFIIIDGKAEVQHTAIVDRKPVTKTLATLSAEEAIGLKETGLYSLSGVRTATVVAVSDLRALRLSLSVFHGFALSHSHVNEVLRKQDPNLLTEKEK